MLQDGEKGVIIQRDKQTYAVAPHISCGVVSPETLRKLATHAKLSGPRIHDARIAALCLHHGVRELWTADRDFSLFPKLKTRNPLVKR